MRVRELIYKLMELELDNEVRIYDDGTDELYKIIRIDAEKSSVDLVFNEMERL